MRKDPADIYNIIEHVLITCTSCNYKITGHDIIRAIMVMAPRRWFDIPCPKCRTVNTALSNRTYHVSDKVLLDRMEYSSSELLKLSKLKCWYPKKKKGRTVDCEYCYPCGARRIVYGR